MRTESGKGKYFAPTEGLVKLRSALPCDTQYGVETQLDILICRRPITDADPHRRAALPYGPCAPARAALLNRLDGALSLFGVSEGNQDLIQYNVIQHFISCSS